MKETTQTNKATFCLKGRMGGKENTTGNMLCILDKLLITWKDKSYIINIQAKQK